MNDDPKQALRELGASEAVIEASGGDLVKAISLGGIGRKVVSYKGLYLQDPIGSNFAIPPFDRNEFELFFRNAGYNVSQEYLEFMQKTNGGIVSNEVSFSLPKTQRKIIQFLSFKPSIFHLPQWWISNSNTTPQFFLEIAVDAKEDYLVLKLNERSPAEQIIRTGSVWHFNRSAKKDYSRFSETEVVSSKSCTQISDSFTGFIEKLICANELPDRLHGKEIFSER